ncbi:MAG: hypothetical protein OEZ32_00300 [Nitrospinota bacterium]|nr:hypothetical protein [Nitrospinota bacterium]
MAVATVAVVALAFAAVALVYLAFYDSREDFDSDARTYVRAVRLELFNLGYIRELGTDDVRYVYQKRCYRQCHGESAMITAILSPSGWIQVVERMRMKEKVEISGREADVIIRYLEEKYPTTKSGYSYEVRKAIHHAVWRNDMGQGDIYCDVVLATPQYLKSIGAEHLIDEYQLKDYDVFIVAFTVHEGEVALAELDNIAWLRTPDGKASTIPPWRLRFQTADKHHYEADIRFRKVTGGKHAPKWVELGIENVGGPETRVFRWELPIQYPKEIEEGVGQ